MAASNELKTLYERLINGTNSLVLQYQNKEKVFPYNSIEKEKDTTKLNTKFNEFSDLLKEFQNIHYELSVHIIKGTQNNETEKCNMIATAYISLIQNLYLNKINFRKSYLENKKSLRVAWIVAIVSFILSVISIGITYFDIKHTDKSTKTENVQTEVKKE